ncbi:MULTISPECIES: large conductance mechanosensitive channel protein MscL [Streptomyces]|uniref:Large-conductance mechanosensitive channel n=1 Tax=Streptomyces cinereoruber TaxID=67260 RepID=A0ABX6BCX4_9ACTN|nr:MULTISPECIES: large conductance mechanosensitive channel protein MscL [Streptomyces]AVH97038.1 large conductance mechanosensitive channel protein MscL [Streptomyces sp. WAC00288]PVC65266.1 large conductance mechanosensitive channel protein MscL [Streptomyces sp. CS081A]QEV33208.1 large conductance mechanosensitive channel protein MscL [Streptomyces cinereoruber]
MVAKKETVLGGFKAFLMRGNVIDLAVAVVIGAAFTNIVNSVVKGIINPVVGAFGTKDLESYSTCIKDPCQVVNGEMQGIQLQWGLVLSAVLSFLITAAVVYFLMVLPMAKILAKRAAHDKAKEGVQETMEVSELEVLKEIRDHLVAQRGPATGTGTAPGAGPGSGPGSGSGAGGGTGAHPTS